AANLPTVPGRRRQQGATKSKKLPAFSAQHLHTERPVLEALVESEIAGGGALKRGGGKYTRGLRHLLAYLRTGERTANRGRKTMAAFAPWSAAGSATVRLNPRP